MRKDPDEMGVLQVKTTAPKQYAPSRLKPEIRLLMDDIDTVSVRTQEESSLERRLRLLVSSIYRGARCICLDADHRVVLLQAMKVEPPLDAKCRDKFLVQSVAVTSDKEFTNINEIVRTTKSKLIRSHLTRDSGSMLARLRNPLSKRRRSELSISHQEHRLQQQHP
jgi:hypothetical protein